MNEYRKMIPEIKKKWLCALRRGDYRQGRGQLVDSLAIEPFEYTPQFCCLGVLYDVIEGRDAWDGEGITIPGNPSEGIDETYHDGELPPEIFSKYQLDYAAMQELMKLNDGSNDPKTGQLIEGKSFAYIADWIEENL